MHITLKETVSKINKYTTEKAPTDLLSTPILILQNMLNSIFD